MNVILLDDGDFFAPGLAFIAGPRAGHMINVLKKQPGDRCRVGMLCGGLRSAAIRSYRDGGVELAVDGADGESVPPPEPLPIVLAAALPRPKTFRKLLLCAGTSGVKEIHFFGAFKVDKSYWQSPFLEPGFLRGLMLEALAQAVDTVPWSVSFHRFFKPFAEDVLPGLAVGKRLLVCHPSAESVAASPLGGVPAVVCLGPEGGFTDYEAGLLKSLGGELISLGPRILRTEYALPYLLGRLF
ncbi:MAG: RsmE family RNA methyltransferase [Victivallaceae bacterium]|nr:RsmE family RNA methyltransferase [Victivallaceae bacterium]